MNRDQPVTAQGSNKCGVQRLPDQVHVMTDVDYHASNLWFAGKRQNWPLAEFYLDVLRSHLNWALQIRPMRKLANGADLDLQPIL